MCGAAVGNYGAAVGNQAQLVGKCGPLPPAGWTETERKRPAVRGLKLYVYGVIKCDINLLSSILLYSRMKVIKVERGRMEH